MIFLFHFCHKHKHIHSVVHLSIFWIDVEKLNLSKTLSQHQVHREVFVHQFTSYHQPASQPAPASEMVSNLFILAITEPGTSGFYCPPEGKPSGACFSAKIFVYRARARGWPSRETASVGYHIYPAASTGYFYSENGLEATFLNYTAEPTNPRCPALILNYKTWVRELCGVPPAGEGRVGGHAVRGARPGQGHAVLGRAALQHQAWKRGHVSGVPTLARGCQLLVTEQCQTLFKKAKILDFPKRIFF